MPHYKLQPVSLLQVKTELKNHICNRFYGISCEGPVSMEQVLKNADISILSNFLAIFFGFFSLYREILPSTIYMPNFRSIDHPNRNYRGGGGSAPPSGHTNLQKARSV